MILHDEISDRVLFRKIKHGTIVLAGNRKLRIYGKLGCVFGKRMKRENRVFSDQKARRSPKVIEPAKFV